MSETIDRTKYEKRKIIEEWQELDQVMPYKVVTGKLPVMRFPDEHSAMDFFFHHKGRCLVSKHTPAGTRIVASRDPGR